MPVVRLSHKGLLTRLVAILTIGRNCLALRGLSIPISSRRLASSPTGSLGFAFPSSEVYEATVRKLHRSTFIEGANNVALIVATALSVRRRNITKDRQQQLPLEREALPRGERKIR